MGIHLPLVETTTAVMEWNLPTFEISPFMVPGSKNKKKAKPIRKYQKIGRPNVLDKKQIVAVVEDYFGNDMSIKDICIKHKSNPSTVSKYISMVMFSGRNGTETITLKSKV